MSYLVTWTTEYDDDEVPDPARAAMRAWEQIRTSDSQACAFTVQTGDSAINVDLLDLDAQDVRDLAEAFGADTARCSTCGRYGEPVNPITGAHGIDETKGVCTPECPERDDD